MGVYMTVHTPGWVGVMLQNTCLFEESISRQESCLSGKGTGGRAYWEGKLSLMEVSR